MKILIPPSEGKANIKKPMDTKFGNTDFKYMDEVKKVIRLLSLIRNTEIRSIYGTSQEKAELFHRQNQDAMNSRVCHAIDRYTGVVYDHIDWQTLSEDAQDYMDKYVGIFSGLFGLVTPRTLIPNYKLKMNVQALQYFWRPILTNILKEEELVIDLLPQVHRKSYDKKEVNVIEVEFLIFNTNTEKTSTAGHYGKAVKGEFIRFMALNNVKSIDDFKGFAYEGFKWNGKSFMKEVNE
mgnify:CR=1 FL=1